MAEVGNLSLFGGGSAVQSRPKSHTFTVNLAVFAPQPRWQSKTVEGSIKFMFSLFDQLAQIVAHWARSAYQSAGQLTQGGPQKRNQPNLITIQFGSSFGQKGKFW